MGPPEADPVKCNLNVAVDEPSKPATLGLRFGGEEGGVAIDEQVVRRETVLPVDRETAWAALCDADELATWLADEVDLEIRPGAEGVVRWDSGEERQASVEEVEERRRLVLRWWEPGGQESIVELTLDDVPDGTRLVVIEVPVVALRVAAAGLDIGRQASPGPQMLAAVA
jgi:uncharacterized protein YndB with AHSA1/START domain